MERGRGKREGGGEEGGGKGEKWMEREREGGGRGGGGKGLERGELGGDER